MYELCLAGLSGTSFQSITGSMFKSNSNELCLAGLSCCDFFKLGRPRVLECRFYLEKGYPSVFLTNFFVHL
ncbi:hypothetical protein HanXRQr2_Chr16g0772551 [Helianthus annuus]|uniref:Uncharacterized protein n=1 Tax=Helianthus annuus TaxID=4232 RepID=A0A251S2R1_HELAN|nr:hypothetical protein HanXRQr2_Chr16g0772551 [Helianthus annuus]